MTDSSHSPKQIHRLAIGPPHDGRVAGHQRSRRIRLGTVTGAITRRYHGLLIAALPNPLGRMMMLNELSERLRLPDRRVIHTGAQELAGIPPEATTCCQ